MATLDPTTNDDNLPKLGSLAQSVRTKQLKGARGILIAIGILNVVVNGAVMIGARSLVEGKIQDEVKELTKKGMVFDPVKLEELKGSAVRTTQLTAAGFMGLGVLFILFGIMVYRFPVPCTVSALVLYVAGSAIAAAIDPTTLAQGLIVKIIIIVALAKAIKSAIAYQRELQVPMPESAG